MPSSNYTVTSVVYTAASGTNVYNAHPTAVLTITPNIGYEIFAADFLWTNTDLNYINTVVFTQDGQNVLCTVTFDNPFTMPAANVDLALCISGSANISELCCDIDLCVEGDSVNYSVQAGSPIPEDITINVCGTEGQQVQLFQRTYTASSGYYLETQPSVVLEIGDQDQYAITETPTLNSDGKVVSVTVGIKYIFKSTCGINDKVNIKLFRPLQIQVPEIKITNYTLDTSDVGDGGASRIMRVFGNTGATFTVTSSNGQILNLNTFTNNSLDTYTITPTQTIPSVGYVDVYIEIPESSSIAEYCFTLAGDLIDPFPQPIPACIRQYPKITLTFNTTGTNLTVTNTILNSSQEADSTVTRTYPANSVTQVGTLPYKNQIVYTVVGSAGQTLSLNTSSSPSITNYYEANTMNSEAVQNSNIVPVVSSSNITTGMRMEGENVTTTGVPPEVTVSNINGNTLTVSHPQSYLNIGVGSGSISAGEDLTFSNRKGTNLVIAPIAIISNDGLTATVSFEGSYISKYGDSSQTFTLDLTSLITVGSANDCKEWDVTVGANGGILVYFDCVKKTKRQLVIFKGESDFSICAMTSPAPTVSGTMSIAASGDVCDFSGVDATCVTWSIAYTNSPQGKSVDVTYFDCVTLAENTITVGRGQTVTQCATRQTPVSTSNSDNGATITITNLTCTP
mgnify:FL=1